MSNPPSSATVGAFIDSVAGTRRTPGAVAGRLVEEVVELALSAGLTAGQIMAHTADALHNQALKASRACDRTVFPSQLLEARSALPAECADVSLVLKDLCHVTRVDLALEEAMKWHSFTTMEFRVSESGTLYAVKPHITE